MSKTRGRRGRTARTPSRSSASQQQSKGESKKRGGGWFEAKDKGASTIRP